MASLNVILICYLYFSMALGQLKIEKTFMSSKRIAASSIQVDEKIYFVGGYEYSDLIATDKIDVYNTANKTWEKPLKLPSPRAYVSPVKSGSTIYFAGGFTQENCTKLYSPETHNYEWTTGCGSTVRSAKQLSVHNDILTVLGNFSADFYDMKNKNWTHSEELTSWMQRVSMGVLFVYEDIIVGIGGLDHSTLDPYSGAWVFNSTTKKLSTFNDVTTLSKTNLDFNFTLMSDTISVWLEDRYLLHRIGSSEWLEVMDNDIIYVATLGHETFIVKSSGFGVYDWNTHASNMTVDSRQIYNVFTVNNQIVLCKNDSLAIYDGTWTYVPMDLPIQRAAPSFGQYILYDGVLFFYYNPETKTVTALTGGFVQIGSIVAINSTTFTAFTSSGAYRVLFENGIATRYGVEYPAMDGQFAIGRDVIDPKSGIVWANVTDTVTLKSKPLTWSRDGTVITVQPIKTQYTMIDIYDYVTGEWKEPVQLNFTMTKVTFLQAFMIQNTLGLTYPSGKYYFFNMTSGDAWFLQKFGSFPNGNYGTFSQVPVYNNVGYFMVDARNLIEITTESLNLINNQVSAVSYLLHQTYNDNTRAVYMSTYSTDPATFGTFYRIVSYDYTSSSWNLFLLPQSQTRLFYAVAQEVLLTFGGDGQLTYTYVPLQGAEWHNITYDMQYDPSIITTLDDGTVLMAGGQHPVHGFYTDEVKFLDVTNLLAEFITTPHTDPIQTPTTISNGPSGLSTGELIAAIVVPVGVVAIAGVLSAVLLVQRNKRRKRRGQSTTIGLATKYGDWYTPFEQIVFEEQIGQGGSGQVFKGKWKNTTVAFKVSMTEANSTVIGELELMVQMRPHPNVVQLFGFSVHPETQSIILIIEYCDGGSLQTVLEDSSVEITMTQKREWMLGVAKGLAHLHSHNIVHRDVAARNVLLSHNEPKLTDFGLSRLVEERSTHGTTKSELGPIRWMAPESLRNKKYSFKSDAWSYGILMYEILAREEPHLDLDPIEVGLQIRDTALTPVIPSDCPTQLASIMKGCWNISSNSRPSIEDIVQTLSSE